MTFGESGIRMQLFTYNEWMVWCSHSNVFGHPMCISVDRMVLPSIHIKWQLLQIHFKHHAHFGRTMGQLIMLCELFLAFCVFSHFVNLCTIRNLSILPHPSRKTFLGLHGICSGSLWNPLRPSITIKNWIFHSILLVRIVLCLMKERIKKCWYRS